MKPKPKKRKKYLDPGTILLIKQIVLGLIIFSSVALVITAIWYGTRLSTFTLDTVTVEGGFTIDKKKVETIAREQLTGSYFKLIPKKFSYLYPEESILERVNQIEKIKDVKVDRVSRKEISVTFDEYLPDALWCDSNDHDSCLFLDKEGYAFAKAPNLSGSSLVRYYDVENRFEINTKPFSEEYYVNSKEFTYLLSQLGWYVVKIEINSTGDVFYTLARGSEIKANLDTPAIDTVSNLQTIINSEQFSHLEPGNFLYLDLRFGSRVFVNEEVAVPEEEGVATSTEEAADDTEEELE